MKPTAKTVMPAHAIRRCSSCGSQAAAAVQRCASSAARPFPEQQQQQQQPVVHGLRCCDAVARRYRGMCWGAGRSPSRRTPTCCTRSRRRPGPPAAPTTTRGVTCTGAVDTVSHMAGLLCPACGSSLAWWLLLSVWAPGGQGPQTAQPQPDRGGCRLSLGASSCGRCSPVCAPGVQGARCVGGARGQPGPRQLHWRTHRH